MAFSMKTPREPVSFAPSDDWGRIWHTENIDKNSGLKTRLTFEAVKLSCNQRARTCLAALTTNELPVRS
jgi:hypothetical protein